MEDVTFEGFLELIDGGFGDVAGDLFRMFCPYFLAKVGDV
jgi:hypothetical protein